MSFITSGCGWVQFYLTYPLVSRSTSTSFHGVEGQSQYVYFGSSFSPESKDDPSLSGGRVVIVISSVLFEPEGMLDVHYSINVWEDGLTDYNQKNVKKKM